MYKIKDKFKNSKVFNLKLNRVIYLNNSTSEEDLKILFEKNHPAIYEIDNGTGSV